MQNTRSLAPTFGAEVSDYTISSTKYNDENTLDYTKKQVNFQEFIDYDFIHFSNSDNIRSIPNLLDGLKPSQRKILYCWIFR